MDVWLYMVTWNVATRHPEEDLAEMLGFGTSVKQRTQERLPDFYAIGLQEVKSQPQNILMDAIFDDPWTNAYRDVLAKWDYVKVKTIRLQGLLLSLFCLRKHLLHLRDIETQYTRTGLGGMWGNKGAVTIRMSIYGCSVCFVNCHLTPHDHLLQERVTDYNNIIRSQLFRARETSNIFFHDYVFWIGDMNFRLVDGYRAEEIDCLIKKGELTTLLDKDQLRQVMSNGEAFSELSEHMPPFPPTYKFEFHSSKYDLKRRPSWTDRILYRVNANVYENLTLQAEQISYRSVEEYVQSDHKPVAGEFIIKVFSDYYERVVEFLPVDLWYVDEENSASYALSGDVQPTVWDWIGVFRDGFTSLDDYLCYVYAARGSVSGNRNSMVKKVVFPDTAVRVTGPYRLLYFSHNSGCVLGMSEAFEVGCRDNGQVTQFVCRDSY
ncbi:phosphatidylinositol 4,5-bisphosphate 5-phosphatase A-like isoform X2 [Zootermopsis nevadensis]|uniref:Phosphatidylinositol 4,5-bisphosphate 5-phosphatase A n=1 Tax=Zootermopsis nevadensis TaxID=136037 RepID=A0A067QIQ3_ZOONE|nr:phosphatidylinositol 4,5-bisphosphate 5-phosphatase A-like isoform X2 [Zootermopsis nevadensis]XP_021940911.1 phosphatidylinositol 4,5-bisphosphate 5-phosphatase A-like isoform X2 [Zootermopsis nevadensis]XP_021940912.1 phosphatidylinositol 4,5-bisphosphate 5-phosphatase A-like isoform X2 [Zootermopsis nevadensis]KDR07202.1 Phosphatidylinositol 4,5-bisphosphate 5-phosphatase A [Zootermopsis nevadensis]